MLDEVFWQKAREVFEHWVEVENDNLTRVRTRLLTCRVPDPYKTNDTWVGGWTTLSLRYPNVEQFDETTARLNEPLAWVGEQLLRKGDLRGAAKVALLHRHLFGKAHSGHFANVLLALNARLGKQNWVYAGVDYLADVVQNAIEGIE